MKRQRAFHRRHGDGAPQDNEQLLLAVQGDARLIRGGKIPTDQLEDGVRRAAKMKSSGGSALDREKSICHTLEDYFFNNPHAEVGFRSQDEKYLSGPVVLVSESLVAGIAPPAVKK